MQEVLSRALGALQGGQYSGRLAKAVGALQGTQDSLQGDPIHTSEEKLIQGSEGREGPAGPGGLEGTAGPSRPSDPWMSLQAAHAAETHRRRRVGKLRAFQIVSAETI